MALTLFDKVWNAHVIADLGGGVALLHVDRHLLHDLGGGKALAEVAGGAVERLRLATRFGNLIAQVIANSGNRQPSDRLGRCGAEVEATVVVGRELHAGVRR